MLVTCAAPGETVVFARRVVRSARNRSSGAVCNKRRTDTSVPNNCTTRSLTCINNRLSQGLMLGCRVSDDHDGSRLLCRTHASPMEPGGDSRDGDDKSAPCGWLSKISNKQSRLVEKIKDLGAAGFVAYGMLNTLYYCVAFLVVWLSMGEIPRGLGYTEASKRLAAVLAVVWMGSQVTKLARAGCAIVLAPAVEKVAQVLTVRLGLKSPFVAYALLCLGCFATSSAVFGSVILFCAH
mmetsp:Transcript_20654/g.39249  ORF Transcript_20654/g.39249 Transcript_20654/m.39249 type:complete len:237 (+) Transcript_20654:54-764(+)